MLKSTFPDQMPICIKMQNFQAFHNHPYWLWLLQGWQQITLLKLSHISHLRSISLCGANHCCESRTPPRQGKQQNWNSGRVGSKARVYGEGHKESAGELFQAHKHSQSSTGASALRNALKSLWDLVQRCRFGAILHNRLW